MSESKQKTPKMAAQCRYCSTRHVFDELLQWRNVAAFLWSFSSINSSPPPSPFFSTPFSYPQPPSSHARPRQGRSPCSPQAPVEPLLPLEQPRQPLCCYVMTGGGGRRRLHETMTGGSQVMCIWFQIYRFLCCVLKFISRVWELLKSWNLFCWLPYKML
jgi:hypothetical protein